MKKLGKAKKIAKKTDIERIIDAIIKLDSAGILDVEIETFSDGKYETAEDLADALEEELSYAAEASE